MKKEEVTIIVINAILDQVGKQETEITEEAKLNEDLKMDELNMVEFVMALEETIGLEIDDEACDKHFQGQTVGSVIDYIVEQIKERGE